MSALSFILADLVSDVYVRVQGLVLEPAGVIGATRYKVISGIVHLVEKESIQVQFDAGLDVSSLVLIDESPATPVVVELPREKLSPLWACICRLLRPADVASKTPRGVKLIVPCEAGYIIRSDIFEERLRGCLQVQTVEGLVVPGQFVQAPGSVSSYANSEGLAALLQSVICCVLVCGSDENSITQSLDIVQLQLSNRLSFPWFSATQIAARRIAVVGEIRSYVRSVRFFHAARALGLIVVAIGNSGHWLEKDTTQNTEIREEYIQLDMTADPGLPDRIATTVRSYHHQIDGIVTVTDYLLASVAEAAQLLDLPTLPPAAYGKAVDKYATRLETSPDSCVLVSNHDYISRLSKPGAHLPSGPPWIVKPCHGFASTGIIKVASEEGLVPAVEKVSSNTGYSKAGLPRKDQPWQTNVLVEEYCDGPEVDCDFVLWDGEILFYAVHDNFPCTGDDIDDGSANFKETQSVFPTTLPASEQLALRDYLHQSILRLGFRSGIFHTEARVRHSSHEYRKGDVPLDLRPRPTTPSQEPSVFLIEINARPPGSLESIASAASHGIDFYALQILIALGDEFRIRALANPYQTCVHVALAAIEAGKSGIVMSDDPWQDLRQKNPVLMSHVIYNMMNFRKGDEVGDPNLDTTLFLSGFILYSSKSRAEVLDMCTQVKTEFHCEIE
ncbi:hypothetical protein FQN49_002326 [Arthroderma sp. PD_2]|nr:hypothetical protein FQN49_002326 [Arthroderma sp. PD_2]